MSNKLAVTATVGLSALLVVVYHFVNYSNFRLCVLVLLALLSLVSSFIVWKRCGRDDEDKLLWLGFWLSMLLIAFAVFCLAMFSYLMSILFFGIGVILLLSLCLTVVVMNFSSHIDESLPKLARIIINIVVPVIIIAYLVYLFKYAPTETVFYYPTGIKVVEYSRYYIASLLTVALVIATFFNVVVLQIKLYFSDKRNQIDLWLASTSLYFLIPPFILVLITPVLIENLTIGRVVIQLSNYMLIPVFVFISVASIIRIQTGVIERNEFAIYSGRHENRMPKTE